MSTTRLPQLLPLDPAPSMELSQFRKGERAVSVMACENYAKLYAHAYGLAVWNAAMEAVEARIKRMKTTCESTDYSAGYDEACDDILAALPLPEQGRAAGSPQERREG